MDRTILIILENLQKLDITDSKRKQILSRQKPGRTSKLKKIDNFLCTLCLYIALYFLRQKQTF